MEEMGEKRIREDEEDVQERHLPHDVIIEHILPLLPVKPLTQLKVVSKLWYSSLSSPNFILKHAKQPLFSHSCSPIEALIVSYGTSYCLYSLENDDNVPNHTETNSLVRLLNPNFEVDAGDRVVEIGCSNGLIGLGERGGKYLVLWNPATNESHKYYCHEIGVPTDSGNYVESRIIVSWGMGYASSLNDYKVVRIANYRDTSFNFVHVFSLRSSTWRKIECTSDGYFLHPILLASNAKLHCPILSDNFSKLRYVGFDLVHDTFNVVAPETMYGGEMIVIVGGCLSKCRADPEGVLILDVHKHPGRVDSIRLPNSLKWDGVSELFGFTKLGNIVVAYNSRIPIVLGLIDLQLNSIKSHVTNEDQNSDWRYNVTRIHSYSPTQVSPLPFNY